MSSMFHHHYSFEHVAIRILVALSFAFILFLISGGWLW
ncbi:hypothetical protein EV130_101769 [Rhizobium azibense]|uniref:Uncharacterized protein n=1 Tax=Rhizobium azibense TaxID=1136135 RepID=A0A4R3RD14_9HYPH|nr:hypothetical protein EV130_101769 [Rhizobium azibense]TCU40796.1 hypothetical protein EV129_10181 [Rhizobium azibense]